MKVVGIVGSPRKGGNTEILVGKVLEGASDKGAEIKTFKLNELNIRGCQACDYCKQHDGCRQQDDMQEIYRELISADALVVGSPIYISDVNAQTKIFLDRLYAFLIIGKEPKFPRGKKCVLVYSQGMGDDGRKVMEGVADFLKNALGMDIKAIVGGNCLNPLGSVKEREDLLKTAYEAGKSLVG